MTHETTWRIVAVSAIALALLSAAALAIVFVVAFATVGEAVKRDQQPEQSNSGRLQQTMSVQQLQPTANPQETQ